MGQTADELRQEIESKRDDASQKIDQLEQLVTGAADQVRSQVDQTKEQVKAQVEQTKEQVKQVFDWRHQVEEKPLVALGAAFIGGIVLAGMTGGNGNGGGHHVSHPQSDGSLHSTNYGQQAAAGAGLMGVVRAAATRAGLDSTITNMADSLMGTLSERVKTIADDAFPGLADKLQQATGGQSSSSSQSSGSQSSSGQQSAYGQVSGQALDSSRTASASGSGLDMGSMGRTGSSTTYGATDTPAGNASF